VPLESIRVVGTVTLCLAQFFGPRGVVPKLRVVKAEIDGIEAEAVDSAVEPETHVV
jgi:hypothetical protein